ncbi:hypothetical protein [Kitasatospora cheerisanensis]|uniref:Integral membrane protein n=1 Tax=Kitasatospora cheerisanensis KCTC 2395 TaxID=1348663 RepID=A0A066Z057_9ACTN|nr:hypothetical protein [Kitasatospora cheerisanensis]KDN85624.1 hypothetical protein KCH_26410 [Kitasatospora cheerisanensis KCTC 2395]
MDITTTLLRPALAVTFVATVVAVWSATRWSGWHSTIHRWSRSITTIGGLVALVLSVPGVYDRLETVLGVENLPVLLAHLAAVVSLSGVQLLLVPWTYQPGAYRSALLVRTGVAAAVAIEAVVLFVVANDSGQGFTDDYAVDDGVAAFLLAVAGYWALAGAAIAWDCALLAIDNGRAGHHVIAAGQGLIAAGALCCALWGVTESAFVVLTQTAGRAWATGLQCGISSVCIAAFAVFLFAGVTACSVPSPRRRRC